MDYKWFVNVSDVSRRSELQLSDVSNRHLVLKEGKI